MLRRFIWILLVFASVGCLPAAGVAPTPTKTPYIPPTLEPPPTHTPTATAIPPTNTPAATATALPTETPVGPTETPLPPAPESGLPNDHYIFIRPIPQGEGLITYLDRTYPYGSTAGGRLRPHTGVEFVNPQGTPVVAAAGATVFYAGSDAETVFGPDPNFYGNVIVLQINGGFNGQGLFALYGHLSEVGVQTGQTVEAGQEIGKIGGTGIANGGPHLHFEVRLGDPYDYFGSSRNPDLWIAPYWGYGTLAGVVRAADGTRLPNVAINIQAEDFPRYTNTYQGEENHGSPNWGENFTYGDLPEGWYTVSTGDGTGKVYREDVYIRPGETSWVEFIFE